MAALDNWPRHVRHNCHKLASDPVRQAKQTITCMRATAVILQLLAAACPVQSVSPTQSIPVGQHPSPPPQLSTQPLQKAPPATPSQFAHQLYSRLVGGLRVPVKPCGTPAVGKCHTLRPAATPPAQSVSTWSTAAHQHLDRSAGNVRLLLVDGGPAARSARLHNRDGLAALVHSLLWGAATSSRSKNKQLLRHKVHGGNKAGPVSGSGSVTPGHAAPHKAPSPVLSRRATSTVT